MSGKLRVHELAKQLGVTSKELLAQLKEQGEFVKTASSTVEPPVVRKMKQIYAEKSGGDAGQKKRGAPAAAKKPLPKPGQKVPGPKPSAAPGAKPASPSPAAAAHQGPAAKPGAGR